MFLKVGVFSLQILCIYWPFIKLRPELLVMRLDPRQVVWKCEYGLCDQLPSYNVWECACGWGAVVEG